MSHLPYPLFDFNANENRNQDFNPFNKLHHHDSQQLLQPAKAKQFPSVDMGTLEHSAYQPRLPPLEDVNNLVTNYWMQLGPQPAYNLINHDSETPPKCSQTFNQINLTSSTSLQLLGICGNNLFKCPEDVVTKSNETALDCGRKLSTDEILKLAAEKFIKFSTQKVNGYTMFTHPYGSSAFTSLSIDETREVELVFQLLTAAEKVGRKQFDTVSKLLKRCEWVANKDGSPVERLVFYVCEALRKRIGKETGKLVPSRIEKQGSLRIENQLALGSNPSFLACHQALPFNQVLQFTGIQAIIEQVSTSHKVHLIDLHIRSGVQWTALMQALAEHKSQVQLLKLTALTTPSMVHQTEETGKRLESFAESLSLHFSFKILVLSDITEVQEGQFEVQSDEAVAVYCQIILRTMISRPKCLENLMRAIGKIKPLIVVVAEVEANHNSTSFANRFTDMLFFYSMLFDCFEDCMDRANIHRKMVEGVHLAEGIENIVAAEGVERVSRSVKMSTWRAFFTRFGMVEMALSESCLYQANLVLQQFSCGSSCTIENNAKCLIVGWKGTPLHSLSTWKFI